MCIRDSAKVIKFCWHLTLTFDLENYFRKTDGSVQGLCFPRIYRELLLYIIRVCYLLHYLVALRSVLITSSKEIIRLCPFVNQVFARPRRSRSAAAYSRQTFPWTICRSVCPSLWKTADRIRMPFDIISRADPGIRQVVGFADRSTERGTFGVAFGARHCIQ